MDTSTLTTPLQNFWDRLFPISLGRIIPPTTYRHNTHKSYNINWTVSGDFHRDIIETTTLVCTHIHTFKDTYIPIIRI